MTNLSEEEKTFWKKVPLIDGILKKILRYNREKIHKIFVKQTNYNSNNSILDIGTASSLDDNHNIIHDVSVIAHCIFRGLNAYFPVTASGLPRGSASAGSTP